MTDYLVTAKFVVTESAKDMSIAKAAIQKMLDVLFDNSAEIINFDTNEIDTMEK